MPDRSKNSQITKAPNVQLAPNIWESFAWMSEQKQTLSFNRLIHESQAILGITAIKTELHYFLIIRFNLVGGTGNCNS